MAAVLDILTTPVQDRRVIGWTFEQWALIAAQKPGFPATPQGALALRKAWLMNDEQDIDHTRRDSAWALDLFVAAQREEADCPLPATALR